MFIVLLYYIDKYMGVYKYVFSMYLGVIIYIKWLLFVCNCVFFVYLYWGLCSKFERI